MGSDESWSDYTLTLKARKLRGAEGFLVVFGRKGGDQYWWNIGGWGNREHGIEYNRTPVGRHAGGTIEANRWYDIKVELAGPRIRCFLDGKLVHEESAANMEKFFAVAGRDEKSGELILKVVNTGLEPVKTTLDLKGAAPAQSEAQCILLAAQKLSDNNSLEEPAKVVPVSRKLNVPGSKFTHEFPPASLTVLRLKTK